MADISKIKLPGDSEARIIKDTVARASAADAATAAATAQTTAESKVADTKIGTTSIVDTDHVATIPVISTSGPGVVHNVAGYGTSLATLAGGVTGIGINDATESNITARKARGTNGYGAISTASYDTAVKAHLTDGTAAAYSATEQTAARARIGAQAALTAGTNITIDADNKINATDTVYTATDGVKIDSAVIKHSNAITAQTAEKLGTIKFDAQGHITGFTEKAVVDNVTSTDTDKPLSAKQGKLLADRLTSVEGRGRFLSQWSCVTGLPTTDPSTSLPYAYKSGDYYTVGAVAASAANNYRPSGTSYTGDASTVVEPDADVKVGDTYLFDGSTWLLQKAAVAATVTDVQVSGTSVVSGGIANLKALANKDDATGTVAGQTISGVTASYTPAGTVALTAAADGAFQPAGTNAESVVTITKTDDTFVKSVALKAGEVDAATFVDGDFTPASISAGFFSAGALPTYSHTGFNGGSLGAATTGDFAIKILSPVVDSDGVLSFEWKAATTVTGASATAVTAQGAFTAATYGTDTFEQGTLPTVDISKFDGGSKASSTFTAQKLPVVDTDASTTGTAIASITEAKAAGQVFTGTKYNPAFTGTAATADVGDIIVAATSVTVS